MPNPYFQFKQFTVFHDRCAMKITTDACLFGAWCSREIKNMTSEQDAHSSIKLLDIGTGTGLLSLQIAQQNVIEIDAVEIDQGAAGQAKENSAASPWKERIRIVNSDILHLSPSSQYDYIVSNPPFYENELASPEEKKNMAHHSSQLSLKQLFSVIRDRLSHNGIFFLLLPYKRNTEAEALIAQHDFFIHKRMIVQQSVSHQPFRLMIMGGREKRDTIESRLSICNDKKQYTTDFTALLSDFYLYL